MRRPFLLLALCVAMACGFSFNACSSSEGGSPGGCSDTPQASRPSLVDHSRERYFPPIGKQRAGDCTCWSSAFYYNTYTQAKDEDLDASDGDPKVVNSARFLFSLISQGTGGAEGTELVMGYLADVGCAPIAEHPMTSHWKKWPSEAAWVAALKNRPGRLRKVRADTVGGLEEVRQHIAAGGCAVTRGLFRANYPAYGKDASGPGIDNGVMYAKVGRNYLRHSLCICGYDDERAYVDHRDGKTRSGAFLIANSEGPNWGSCNSTGRGSRGFLWVAYAMFLEGKFGRYDNDDNPHTDPCHDNPPHPMIYFHTDRPSYRPRLYALAGITHPKRNLLTLTGGVGPAAAPLFLGPLVIRRTGHGAIPITEADRVAVDLTDGAHLLASGKTRRVFLRLGVHSAAKARATVRKVEFFYDPEGDDTYLRFPGRNPVLSVAPGQIGHVKVDIALPENR